MPTGSNNNKFSYEMNGKVLDKVLVEKDLLIMISSDVKSSQQCVTTHCCELFTSLDIIIPKSFSTKTLSM